MSGYQQMLKLFSNCCSNNSETSYPEISLPINELEPHVLEEITGDQFRTAYEIVRRDRVTKSAQTRRFIKMLQASLSSDAELKVQLQNYIDSNILDDKQFRDFLYSVQFALFVDTVPSNKNSFFDSVTSSLDAVERFRIEQNEVVLETVDGLTSINEEGYIIGSGHSANVYRGRYGNFQVAVKRTKVSPSGCPSQLVNTFVHEIEMLCEMKLYNISPIHFYGFVVTDSHIAIVLALVDGYHSSQLTLTGCACAVSVYELILNISKQLAALHSRGIVHLDVRPGNILIDNMGPAYICDMGSSIHEGERIQAIAERYAPPEGLNGNSFAYTAWDSWGLGLVILQLFGWETSFPKYETDYHFSIPPAAGTTVFGSLLAGLLTVTPSNRLSATEFVKILNRRRVEINNELEQILQRVES